MHVLGIHMNAMPTTALSEEWGTLTGLWAFNKTDETLKMMLKKNDVPILLQDPLALVIHFILLLPVNIDKAYFDTIVKACYNLCVVQILVRLTCGLSKKERSALESDHRREPTARKLSSYLGYVVLVMGQAGLYRGADGTDQSGSADLDGLGIADLEASAQELALPFLRIASLVKHYVFERDLPAVPEDSLEFPALVEFLELLHPRAPAQLAVEGDVEAMETESLAIQAQPSSAAGAAATATSVVDGLNWFRPEPGEEEGAGQLEMDLWLQEFLPHVTKNCGKAQQLLQVNLLWRQPVLLKVPKNYDDIFQVSEFTDFPLGWIVTSILNHFLMQYYHKRRCVVCHKVPKDPTVCLMCGTMVCLKEDCCKTEVNGEGKYSCDRDDKLRHNF